MAGGKSSQYGELAKREELGSGLWAAKRPIMRGRCISRWKENANVNSSRWTQSSGDQYEWKRLREMAWTGGGWQIWTVLL